MPSNARLQLVDSKATASGWIIQSRAAWAAFADATERVSFLVDADAAVLLANRPAEQWLLAKKMVVRLAGLSLHDVVHPQCKDPACSFKALPGKIRQANSPAEGWTWSFTDNYTALTHSAIVQPVWLNDFAASSGLTPAAVVQFVPAGEAAGFPNLFSGPLDALESERQRIARDLHDGIGSSLGAINFALGAAQSSLQRGDLPATGELLEKVSGQVKAAIIELRRISLDLRPAILDDLGIVQALAWFCREFSGTYSQLKLVANVSLREENVPNTLRLVIFRVVQEALSNVARHAAADQVEVSLRLEAQLICLEIADNGCAFSPDAAPGGSGLSGMRQRVETSGGCFEVHSLAQRGTRVTAQWPAANTPAGENKLSIV